MKHRAMDFSSQKSFSLFYNDIARWFFLFLFFAGMFSCYVFGIQLALNYAIQHNFDLFYFSFTILSGLGTIWGLMAHREFTRSSDRVNNTRILASQINPRIGKYEYKSYNPETHEFEEGYIPFGPIDFWDPATYAPEWVDKGKYWHVLLGLQVPNKELILQIVKDSDLLNTRNRNVATTEKETIQLPWAKTDSIKRVRYRVKIPQWAVMRADYQGTKSNNPEGIVSNREIGKLNRNIVLLVDEIIEREKFRIKYPWMITGLWIYLYKSLPIKIIYNEILEKLPGFHKSIVKEANETLADIREDRLVLAILEVAQTKGINQEKIEKISTLIRFLDGVYADIGLGEGSTEYHNFHHSLEVSYMALKMLPNTINNYRFSADDIEILLVSALLHDYDPLQFTYNSISSKSENNGYPNQESTIRPSAGPRVYRTIETIQRYQIHDAYFKLDQPNLERVFENFSFKFNNQAEVIPQKAEIEKSDKSLMVEALIWRTDFPYFKQEIAQQKYKELLSGIKEKDHDVGRVNILAEVLWLSDLSVTYMGSDPIRAWNRVTSLYDELFLPKLEAVSRTDSYFSDFADTHLFQELIKMRGFPDVFKSRWNSVYQFFHEGNPSTVLVRTIMNARKSFLKLNVFVGYFKGEIIYQMANQIYAEFFIGIGEDQNEISFAKSKIAELEPQNASVFWGNSVKLLPSIPDRSIDNFILNIPSSAGLDIITNKILFSSMITTMRKKLTNVGNLIVLTDIQKGSDLFNSIYDEILSKGFTDCTEVSNYYLSRLDPATLHYPSSPNMLSFCNRDPIIS
ncbi:MAG TPA: HD domain-containing protein [Nitrososphaeraceae archaeon]|nr:HD domain-containing protein [Nitrososphaeraceae archaeon]